MLRALELAELGRGAVSPNPMVGCVIVQDNKIVGEGWHKQYGGPHAEVNAINSVKDATLLEQAELFVSLEPCAHYGKTPPCADLIIQYPLKKVWIANMDPNPQVNGKGKTKILQQGIDVVSGLLEEEGRELNKRFFTFQEKKRPYIILKWAETSDGFIARENFDSKWISNVISRRITHKWRAEEDAIMVGKNTAMYDNPSLNVRNWAGKNPIRIVADVQLSLPPSLHLFDQTIPTLVLNELKNEIQNQVEYICMEMGENFVKNLMPVLSHKNIHSVLVEGGSNLLSQFIHSGIWDEARIFTGQQTFGNGLAAPEIKGVLTGTTCIENDQLKILKNHF